MDRELLYFWNHASERSAHPITRIAESCRRQQLIAENLSAARVLFIHLERHDVSPALEAFVRRGVINFETPVVLCSSTPNAIKELLDDSYVQSFKNCAVLEDPERFDGSRLQQFVSGIREGQFLKEALMANLVPYAELAAYILTAVDIPFSAVQGLEEALSEHGSNYDAVRWLNEYYRVDR